MAKYMIDTIVFSNGDIEQTVRLKDEEGVREITRQIMQTKESHIKESLIKLGWTPPEASTEGL